MILARTVIVPDSFARANVVEALAGPGRPAGIVECSVDAATVSVRFESSRTAPELIDALIAIECARGPARTDAFADLAQAAAIAARGLHEPELDASRIIETYLA